jgi:hypothetical protein
VIENTWAFPVLEAMHLIGLALLAGMIALGNFRVLGWTTAAPSERIQNSGFWLMVLTGLPMLAAGLDRYRANPAFLVKMLLLVAALTIKGKTRATAILSLTAWTLVVLAARAVIDFDV